MSSMKAVIHLNYGSPDRVLQVREIEKPAVGSGQVLVRVHAASLHPDVWHVITGLPYVLRLMGNGLIRPKRLVPGSDLAGVVESVGTGVTRFRMGDEVFGESNMAWRNGGAFAEHAAVDEAVLAFKPKNVTFAQAASVGSSGLITLSNFSPKRIKAGDDVLINGAGGNVGTLAVQIAKARGARVTGVDHTSRLELVRSLGADRVVDYTKEDALQEPERYDFILDVASTLSLDRCVPVLKPNGIYSMIGHDHYGMARSSKLLGSIPRMLPLVARSVIGNPHLPKPDFKNMPGKGAVMGTLAQMMETGTVTPVVARTFPLDDVLAAMRCMQDGLVAGRIVLTP
jgi:NADPH:quinone reductase-like Zn-dependent oxidoreductase